MGAAYARQLTLTDRTVEAGVAALRGQRHGLRTILPFAGPAVIASVAYMDPGNFATNIQAGAKYNYDLLWVVVLASLVAMLFQALSAKLGIATGRNLAELSREHFPRPVVWSMWAASEIAAMATDLAEFLGCAIGFSLLFGMPLVVGMGVTAIATFAILTLQRRGFRPIELLIGGLVALIGASYLIELLIVPPDWTLIAFHSVVPRLDGIDALTLAVGIFGATVMPHAIYLHSGLTQSRIVARNDGERRKLIRFSNREVVLALGLAGLVNMAMLAMAAAVFHDGTHNGIASIETAYLTLIPLMGIGAAAVFLTSLIASGLSSSVVGTMAGQVIMQGFVGFRIPLWARRVVTMIPSIVVVGLGVDATQALVLSQVVLSLVLPVPMISLLILTRRPEVMGASANGPHTSFAAIAAAGAVLALNGLLILDALGVPGATIAELAAALGAFALSKLLVVCIALAAFCLAARVLTATWSDAAGVRLRQALAVCWRSFRAKRQASPAASGHARLPVFSITSAARCHASRRRTSFATRRAATRGGIRDGCPFTASVLLENALQRAAARESGRPSMEDDDHRKSMRSLYDAEDGAVFTAALAWAHALRLATRAEESGQDAATEVEELRASSLALYGAVHEWQTTLLTD
jgi:manganese transport protein